VTVAATDQIVEYLVQSRNVVQAIATTVFIETVERIADCFSRALVARCKILRAGNGGSAGGAQHLAGEFMSRLNYDRAQVAAVAVTTDSSVLTGIGNDYGYEWVFERQVVGLGQAGDVFVAISTSGRSRNILRAIDAARRTGLIIVGFTGRSGGEMASRCDLCLHAPVVCGLVEERLFPRAGHTRAFSNAAE